MILHVEVFSNLNDSLILRWTWSVLSPPSLGAGQSLFSSQKLAARRREWYKEWLLRSHLLRQLNNISVRVLVTEWQKDNAIKNINPKLFKKYMLLLYGSNIPLKIRLGTNKNEVSNWAIFGLSMRKYWPYLWQIC